MKNTQNLLKQAKKCLKCGEVKSLSEFWVEKGRKDGLRPYCKKCSLFMTKSWRMNNIERDKEVKRKWKKNNSEKVNKLSRIWKKNNPEKVKKTNKQWCKNNPDKVRRYCKKWYKNNTEKAKKIQKKWRKSNSEKRSFYQNQRRIRKLTTGGSFTLHEWIEIKRKQNFTCLGCGKKEPKIKLTIDHIIPLSKGGINFANNLQGLCLSCNSIKYNRLLTVEQLRKIINQ